MNAKVIFFEGVQAPVPSSYMAVGWSSTTLCTPGDLPVDQLRELCHIESIVGCSEVFLHITIPVPEVVVLIAPGQENLVVCS